MSAHSYTVAFLAGDGVGPEVTAEASRALAAVARLHHFRLDEVHLSFGGDAVRRFGHPLPIETRQACREADAVLVALTREPALEGVKADLDLVVRVTSVRVVPADDLTIVSPLAAEAEEAAVERAFRIALARRGRVTSVGTDERWRRLVDSAAESCEGIDVEHLALERALPLVAASPAGFDVIVTERLFAEALSRIAAFGREDACLTASGRLAASGPSIFGPTHGSALDIAGQGVANPSAMLLAASLMLAEGFGERAAAETLERAVAAAFEAGVRTADLVLTGAAATTREFMDVLLATLPAARRDTEFSYEPGYVR